MIGGVGCQLVTPFSREQAIIRAYNSVPVSIGPGGVGTTTINWRDLLTGLEAAGFIRFLGEDKT